MEQIKIYLGYDRTFGTQTIKKWQFVISESDSAYFLSKGNLE